MEVTEDEKGLFAPTEEALLAELQEIPELPAGSYCIEVETLHDLAPDVLAEGLRLMGWPGACVDTAPQNAKGEFLRLAFFGRAAQAWKPEDSDVLAWLRIYPCPFDALAEPKLAVTAFEWKHGTPYALWFSARRRSHNDRAAVRAGLTEMGFDVDMIVEIAKHATLPDRPQVDVGWYVAYAMWTKGDTVVAGNEDPFFFEQAVAIAEPITTQEVTS